MKLISLQLLSRSVLLVGSILLVTIGVINGTIVKYTFVFLTKLIAMSKYLLATNDFGLSEEKFHFLRNRFETGSVKYLEIRNAKIKKGIAVNNWILLLVLGLIFIGTSLYLSRGLYGFLMSGEGGTIYIEGIILPFFLIVIGGFMIYKSLAKEMILELATAGKTYRFPIGELIGTDQLEVVVEKLGVIRIDDDSK